MKHRFEVIEYSSFYAVRDRREWILNEPGLYDCARNEGVKI